MAFPSHNPLPEGPHVVSLDLTGGLTGEPIPSSQAVIISRVMRRYVTTEGLRIANNICLSPGMRAVKTQPGWWRTFNRRLRDTSTYGLDNTKKIVCFDGAKIGLHGTVFAWVEWTGSNARVLSMGYNLDLDAALFQPSWNPASQDIFVVSEVNGIKLGRLGPHEYPPTPITVNGRTYFIDKWSPQTTAYEGCFRESVPFKPTRKPTLMVAADLASPCDFVQQDDDVLTAIGSNSTITQRTSFPTDYPTYGPFNNHYQTIEILATKAKTDLCYRNENFTFKDAGVPPPPHIDSAGGGWMELGRVCYRTTFRTVYAREPVFSGTGVDDLEFCDCPELGGLQGQTILVRIVANSPDAFEWSNDGGATWSPPIVITGASQSLRAAGSATGTIQLVDFTGTGPNDIIVGGAFTGASSEEYVVMIVSVGTGAGGVKAVGDLTFTGQPANNETFSIGGFTFKFKTVASLTTDIAIGAATTDSIDNAVSVINGFSPTFPFVASNSGGNKLRFTVTLAGTGGNGIAFTEAIANATANGSGFLGGTTAGTDGSTAAVKAVGTLTFTGQPAEGETLIIGGNLFTFTAFPSIQTDIQIGLLLSDTIDNIVLTFNAFMPTLPFTAANGGGTTLVVTVTAGGVQGNAIPFIEAIAHATADGAGFLGGTTAGVAGSQDLAIVTISGGIPSAPFALNQMPIAIGSNGATALWSAFFGHTLGDAWTIDATAQVTGMVSITAFRGNPSENDMHVVGPYTGASEHTWDFKVHKTGTPDQYKYRQDVAGPDAFPASTIASMSTSPIDVGLGFKFYWDSDHGHDSVGGQPDDLWTVHAIPADAGRGELCVHFRLTSGHVIGDTWTQETQVLESIGGTPSKIEKVGSLPSHAIDNSVKLNHIPAPPHGFLGRSIYRTGSGPRNTIQKDEAKIVGDGEVPIGAHRWVYTFDIPGIGETPPSGYSKAPHINDFSAVCYELTNVPQAVFVGHEEIARNTKRHIYRADNTNISGNYGASKADIQADNYFLVGTIENNDDYTFTDNVPTEKLGRKLSHLEDLRYFLVTDINDIFTTKFKDTLSMFSLGREYSRIPQPVNHTRVQIQMKYDTTDQRPGLVFEANSIAFVANGSANLALNGDSKEVPITQALQAGVWYILDVPWTYGSFDMKSYGFRLLQRDKNWTASWNPKISVGPIHIGHGEWGPFRGNDIRGFFSWTDTETQVESDGCEATNGIDIQDTRNEGVQFLPVGYRGFFDQASHTFLNDPVGLNWPPTGFKHINAYLSLGAWGKDSLGGAIFRLAVENAKYTVGAATSPMDYAKHRFKIGDKNSPFLGAPNSYTLSNIPAFQQIIHPDEEAAAAIELFFESAPAHNFKGRPPAASQAVLDGQRIVYGPKPRFSVGTLSDKKYLDVHKYIPAVTPITSQAYPWMMDRVAMIDSSDMDYNNPDGRFSTRQRRFDILQIFSWQGFQWIRMGSDFSRETTEWKEAYYGETGTHGWKILPDNNAEYSVNTKLLGANPDYVAEPNVIEIPFVNDRYIGIGHAGEVTFFFGKRSVFRIRQNFGVLDDAILGGAYNEPELIHGAAGTKSPRTIVSKHDSELLYLTSDRRIGMVTPSSFAYYEGQGIPVISDRCKGWLDDNVDAELIEHAHAYYDSERDWYCLHFIERDDAEGCAEEGSTYDVTTPAHDFNYRLIVDMRYGRLFTSDKHNVTCTMSTAADCVANGSSTGKIFGGDQFGFVNELNKESSFSRGVPLSTLRYTVTATASSDTVLTLSGGTLPTAGEGLQQHYVYFSGEERQITANTGSTVTLASAFSTTPLNLIVRLSPIISVCRGIEYHFLRPAVLFQALVDSFNTDASFPTTFTMKVLTASGPKLFAPGNVTGDAEDFTVADLQNGMGQINFRRVASRALQFEMSWIQEQADKPTEVLGVHLWISAQEGEAGRSLSWPNRSSGRAISRTR